MATILNPQSNIWQALGQGLSAGLGELAQGKIRQMQQRQNAEAYEKMGYPREIANLPERLQPFALKEHRRGLDALQKQQEERNKLALKDQEEMEAFKAKLLLGKRLGMNKNDLETVIALGPKAGKEWLDLGISALSKGKKPEGLLQWLGFTQGASKSPFEQASNSYRNELEQQYNQTSNGTSPLTPLEAMSHMSSGSTGLNALNRNESIMSSPQKIGGGTENNFFKTLLGQSNSNLQENPDLTSEQLEQLAIEDMQNNPKSALEYFGGIIPNAISGALQGVGTLGGILPLFESLARWNPTNIPDVMGLKLTEPEIKNAEATIKMEKPGSFGYESSRRILERAEKEKDIPDPTNLFPTAADIKQKVIRPVARALSAERLITNPDKLNSIVERVGAQLPRYVLGSLMAGGSAAQGIMEGLDKAGVAETMGEFAKRIGGPWADMAASMIGYLTSSIRPGIIQNKISQGYDNFREAIRPYSDKSFSSYRNASDLKDTIKEISQDNIFKDVTGGKFIDKVTRTVDSHIKILPKALGKKSKLPLKTLTAKEAFKLDEKLGGDLLKDAVKLGPEAEQAVHKLRHAIRPMYEEYFRKLVPEATQGLINARNMASAFHWTDKVNDTLTQFSKGNTGFFNKLFYGLKIGAGGVAKARKWIHILKDNKPIRDEFEKALKAAAFDDKQTALAAINKINKLGKDLSV